MKSLVVALLCILSTVAQAQEISPLVSFEFGSPLFFNRDAGVLNQFGSDSTGASACYSYGIGADVRWPKLSGNLGIASSLQFLYSTGRFNFDGVGANVTGIDRKLRMELSVLESIGQFGVRAGGWSSSRLSSNVYEHDSSGSNITPPNSTSPAFHAGFVLGTDYSIGNLRASLFGNYDVTAKAGLHGLGAGLSLSYLLSGTQVEGNAKVPIARQNAATVQFTVNDTPHYQSPPVEKVETHIEEYSMQPDTIIRREWIEESYHLPHIKLQVFTNDTVFAVIHANGTLLNRHRAVRNSAFEINELNALDIHKTNQIVAQIENGISADTLVLPDISSNVSSGTITKKEFRFHLTDTDSTRFDRLLDSMKSIAPEVNAIVVRSSREGSWPRLAQKLRSALGDRAKFKNAYKDHEISVVMSN